MESLAIRALLDVSCSGNADKAVRELRDLKEGYALLQARANLIASDITRGARFIYCLLAYMYSPFLVFTYTALEPLTIQHNETPIEFAARCQLITARHLGIGVSTVHWKEQHRALEALGYTKHEEL